jgi:hypothetical protein
MEWIAASEGDKVQRVCNEMAAALRRLDRPGSAGRRPLQRSNRSRSSLPSEERGPPKTTKEVSHGRDDHTP